MATLLLLLAWLGVGHLVGVVVVRAMARVEGYGRYSIGEQVGAYVVTLLFGLISGVVFVLALVGLQVVATIRGGDDA